MKKCVSEMTCGSPSESKSAMSFARSSSEMFVRSSTRNMSTTGTMVDCTCEKYLDWCSKRGSCE